MRPATVAAVVVAFIVGFLVRPAVSDPRPSPSASYVPYTYALHATNDEVETGQVQIYRYVYAQPAIWVALRHELNSEDSKVQLIKGLCSVHNVTIIATLWEVPGPIALDLQGHDHQVVTAYRHWILQTNTSGTKLVDNGLSIVVRDTADGGVKWCGNLMHNNEMSPLPDAGT